MMQMGGAVQCPFCGLIKVRTMTDTFTSSFRNQEKCTNCEEEVKMEKVPKVGDKKDWQWRDKRGLSACSGCKVSCPQKELQNCRSCGKVICNSCKEMSNEIEGYKETPTLCCVGCKDRLGAAHKITIFVGDASIQNVVEELAMLCGIVDLVEVKEQTGTILHLVERKDGDDVTDLEWRPGAYQDFESAWKAFWNRFAKRPEAATSGCCVCKDGTDLVCSGCQRFFQTTSKGECANNIYTAQQNQNETALALAVLLSSYMENKLRAEGIRGSASLNTEYICVCPECCYLHTTGGSCANCSFASASSEWKAPKWYLRIEPAILPVDTPYKDIFRVVKHTFGMRIDKFKERVSLCKKGHTTYCNGECEGQCEVPFALAQAVLHGAEDTAIDHMSWTTPSTDNEKVYRLAAYPTGEVKLRHNNNDYTIVSLSSRMAQKFIFKRKPTEDGSVQTLRVFITDPDKPAVLEFLKKYKIPLEG